MQKKGSQLVDFSEMIIRQASQQDIDSIVSVFTASVHGLTAQYYNDSQRLAWAPVQPDLKQWQQRLASLTTFVAVVDKQIVGFLSYAANGYIAFLYTSPMYARRGIATRLYQQAGEDLMSLGAVKLYTEASLAARPFFQQQGFQIVQEQRVERDGILFCRFLMEKVILPPNR